LHDRFIWRSLARLYDYYSTLGRSFSSIAISYIYFPDRAIVRRTLATFIIPLFLFVEFIFKTPRRLFHRFANNDPMNNITNWPIDLPDRLNRSLVETVGDRFD